MGVIGQRSRYLFFFSSLLISTLAGAAGTTVHATEATSRHAAMPLCLDPSVTEAEATGPCALQAGTYVPEAILVPMSFTIGEGWTNLRSFPDLWLIGRQNNYLSFLVGPVLHPDGFLLEDGNDLLSLLASHVDLEVGDPAAVSIAGRTATSVDATNVGEGLFELDLVSDRFFLEPGDQARFIVLGMDETLAVFIVEGYGDLGLQGAVSAAQPILDSVVWLESRPGDADATE